MRSLVVGSLYRAVIRVAGVGGGLMTIFGICLLKDDVWQFGFKRGGPETLISAEIVPKDTDTGGPPLINGAVLGMHLGYVTIMDVIRQSDVTLDDIIAYCERHDPLYEELLKDVRYITPFHI